MHLDPFEQPVREGFSNILPGAGEAALPAGPAGGADQLALASLAPWRLKGGLRHVGGVIAVWAIELGLFALIVAALRAERLLPLGAAIGGLAVLVVAARASARARAGIAAAFQGHRAAAFVGGAVLALALPVALRASPYWTFVAAVALVYVTIGQGLNLQIGTAGVINLAGAVALGIGLLVTVPLTCCTVTAAYADIFGLQSDYSVNFPDNVVSDNQPPGS